MFEAVHITIVNHQALLKLQVGRVSSNNSEWPYTLRRQVEMCLYGVLTEVRR